MKLRGELGPLERTVMDVVWDSVDGVTVRDVLEQRNLQDLAYTTVMTILDRLWRKGYVSRRRRGRAYAYRPRISREEHVAGVVSEVLAGAKDRREVLLGFVRGASEEDIVELRRALREIERERNGRDAR